jgi:hypothetical protein
MYGWQDGLMARIDRWSSGERGGDGEFQRAWYGDLTGVRLSGFLGLGTELFVLTLCALFDRTGLYFLLNVAVMNAWWAMCILYRRWVLRPRLVERTDRG